MALIKDGVQVSDQWISVPDDAPVQADIPTIITYQRFLNERETLLRSQAELGVHLDSADDVTALREDLDRIRVVVLSFPKFTDGRSYSAARLLRQRYGYQGEVRATGNVLYDQYAFMRRAGFDAFQVKDGSEARFFAAKLKDFSHYYQTSADAAQAVWAKRMVAAHMVAARKAADCTGTPAAAE